MGCGGIPAIFPFAPRVFASENRSAARKSYIYEVSDFSRVRNAHLWQSKVSSKLA
ncbi:MAG: hypothetical protein F6J93_32985 [Oscillatoria sp. SIO1A7]|nr:hypothetical protein [Oscillatoria sp. SIO1A7]